ncbi:hypothetical protein E2C01_035774 [Portunus trituberculatus]|uniref:Uncharacterized protein n=1 Tax=Portunus trituberculatus TaxID=210409 RepID=A0A5B7F422_PORTR|nr:hypothetical protein [Portunus trituberculatus]
MGRKDAKACAPFHMTDKQTDRRHHSHSSGLINLREASFQSYFSELHLYPTPSLSTTDNALQKVTSSLPPRPPPPPLSASPGKNDKSTRANQRSHLSSSKALVMPVYL